MRVALDVSALTAGLRSGTAVYVYRLVEALAANPGLDLRVLYNGLPGVGERLAASLERPNAKVLCSPLRWRGLPAPIFDRPYPEALRREVQAADLFHIGEFVYPRLRSGQAVVATVHDVSTELHPEWHSWRNRVLHHRRLAWIRRHATRVIIDAEATRADAAAVLGLPLDRLDVVPLARGTAGFIAQQDHVRQRLGLGAEPFALCVGTLEPRKNLIRLVAAFRRLSPDLGPVRLVLAGPWGWQTGPLRAALKEQCEHLPVTVTGGVDDPTLRALYAGATVFAYPSLCEGFGLPLLEAMAAGVPVLTSAGGACAEVAGDAALLVDPLRVDAITAALDRLLRSESERRTLAQRGLRRERQFSWARTAERTVAVYERALAAGA